jgi:hypothetical protein
MKDWELHLALQDPQDPFHDITEAQLAGQDELERRRCEEPNGEPAGRARDQAQGGP